MMALYACPKCKDEHNLTIAVVVTKLLLQNDDNDEYETELISGENWWNENSYMTCRKCLWEGCTGEAWKRD